MINQQFSKLCSADMSGESVSKQFFDLTNNWNTHHYVLHGHSTGLYATNYSTNSNDSNKKQKMNANPTSTCIHHDSSVTISSIILCYFCFKPVQKSVLYDIFVFCSFGGIVACQWRILRTDMDCKTCIKNNQQTDRQTDSSNSRW